MSEFSPDKLEIIKRKDAYLCEWVDDYRKFNYPRLIPKYAFYLRWNDVKRGKGDRHISVEQYEHLKNLWQTFNFKTFRDFHDHYLKKDMLLLADILEPFISTCLKYYNLDRWYYFSAPLSWNAKLKVKNLQIEEVVDSDKHILVEGGMRGGICYAAKKYIVKQITNFVLIMIIVNQELRLNMMTWIIYTTMQWWVIYRRVQLDGLELLIKTLTQH